MRVKFGNVRTFNLKSRVDERTISKKYDFFDFIHGEYSRYNDEPEKLYLTNCKIKATKEGIELKYNGNKYQTDALYHKLHDTSLFFFEDKNNAGDGYAVTRSGQIYGPFDANKIVNVTGDVIRVVDKDGNVIHLDKYFLNATKTNFVEVKDSVYKDVTTNKYGIVRDGEILTPALFDSNNLVYEFFSDGCYVLENDTLYSLSKHGKVKFKIENYGKKIRFPIEGPNKTLIFEGDFVNYVVVDNKVVYTSETECKCQHTLAATVIVFNHKNGDGATCVSIDNGKLQYVTKIDGYVEDVKQDVLAIKKTDGKCGLMNSKGEELMPFEYDGFTLDTRNDSKIFMGLTNGNKIGLYNCHDKVMTLPVKYSEIVLDHAGFTDKYVREPGSKKQYNSNNLYRFLVKFDDNDKYGIVNSKGHTVLGPVLSFYNKINDSYYQSHNSTIVFEENYQFQDLGGIYICLESPHLFPTTPRIVHHSTEKEVKEVKTHSKYSDEEILGASALGTLIVGSPLAGMVIGNQMGQQKYTTTSTKIVKSTHTGKHVYNVPSSILEMANIDYDDIPKDVLPDNVRQEAEKIKKAKEEVDRAKKDAHEAIENADDVLDIDTNDKENNNDHVNENPNNKR